MSEVQSDLFAWAAEQPQTVIDLKLRREAMRRWPDRLGGFDLAMARSRGKLPPAPIIPFTKEHPASPGSYSSAPTRRQG